MENLLIIGLIFSSFLFGGCSKQENIGTGESQSGTVDINSGITEKNETQVIKDNIGNKVVSDWETYFKSEGITQNKDGKYVNKDGYIIYNAKNCILDGQKYSGNTPSLIPMELPGIYDWIDDENKEAGCFDKITYKTFQEGFGYSEDIQGTYYMEKASAYNLQRISKVYGGKLVSYSFDNSEDQEWFFIIGNKVYSRGMLLEGVTNIKQLKDINYGNKSSGIITNGKKVWLNSFEIEGADPKTFKILSDYPNPSLYIDKTSCYIEIPYGQPYKLEDCNSKNVKIVKDKKEFKTPGASENDNEWYHEYTDGIHNWDSYGQKIYQEITKIKGVDTKTFKVLSDTERLYVDKNSCYISSISDYAETHHYIKLDSCNPNKVEVVTDPKKFKGKNIKDTDYGYFEYTDGIHNWDNNGTLIK